MKKQSISALICASLAASQAFGAGFEKTTTWSGRYAGMGSAAVSSVTGAESLYFNPAGLAGSHGTEFSLNFSPTFGQYSGPIIANNTSLDSSRKMAPVFGALASYSINENLGVGFGVYASGGTKAIYEGVNFAAANPYLDTLNPNIESDLSVVEVALGAGYTILPGLRIGAAWRMAMIKALLDTAQTASAGSAVNVRMAAIEMNDLSATQYNGFKVGIEYTHPEKTWGLGANWRSSLDFTAKGTSSVRDERVFINNTYTPAGVNDNAASGTGGDVSVASTFPTQISIGGFYDMMSKVRIAGEYVWTQYSKNQSLAITGTGTLSTGNAFNYNSIDLSWQNQTNLRLGLECTALENWAFRAGYVYTSQVTPAGSARATFASPGAASTVTLGAGTSFMEHKLDVNGALEYSFASGTVDSTNAPDNGAKYGDYKTNAYAVHTGLTYHL